MVCHVLQQHEFFQSIAAQISVTFLRLQLYLMLNIFSLTSALMASLWGSLRNFLSLIVGVNACNDEGGFKGVIYGVINKHMSTLCGGLIATQSLALTGPGVREGFQ